jgi:hypothetical protein
MKIEFSVDGGLAGFPGLRKPVTIDAGTLSAAGGAHLRQLVERAAFFTTPMNPAAAANDGRCYTIAIDDGGECRTLTVAEPIANPAMQALVAELSARAREVRARQRGDA